ncbi:MAG: zf-HC2 domain-containing protein [Candidatus Limnocylindria bacterium]
MNRHESFEELISASLAGDLSESEHQRLNAHLAGCDRCRAIAAAYADQRRIMAGLRHQAPPRDLDARIRAGIEGGRFARLPWWRRPPVLLAGVGGGLAAVAGALLAVVLLSGTPSGPPVGQGTPSPSLQPTEGATAPASPIPSSDPSVSASAQPSASSQPGPTATPVEPASPEPDLFLAITGPVDNRAMTVRDGETGETLGEVETPPGPPIAAELSPDGQWIAYITEVGEKGTNEVRATRLTEPPASDDPSAPPPVDSPVAVGDTVVLGESVAGSPFLEHLSWSSDGLHLAFTLAVPEAGGTDVWVFDATDGAARQLTDVGNAYAGSWVVGDVHTSLLWVSVADSTPRSYLMSFREDSVPIEPSDPADGRYPSAENVFQPLVTPNGALVIFWTGRMEEAGAEWLFVEGGSPWLAESDGDGTGGYEFTNGRELFSDLSIGQNAFASAAIAWGPDGDAYAVWDARWTGTSQGPADVLYPDESAVYFGHASDERGLTIIHSIDDADLADGDRVIDVKVAPTGRHLVISAARPRAGVLDPATAELLLVTRNTGGVADDVEVLGSGDGQWFGPAVFAAPPAPDSP